MSTGQINAKGTGSLNHARIAAEALRYRLDLLRVPVVDFSEFDFEQMADATVAAGDPTVDGAMRRITEAWKRAGLAAENLCQPWDCPEVRALFEQRPDLVDALDDIVRAATRSQAA